MDSITAIKIFTYLNKYLLNDISEIICKYILTQRKNIKYDAYELINILPTENKNYLCSDKINFADNDIPNACDIYYGNIKYIVSKIYDFLKLSSLQIDYNLYQFKFYADANTLQNEEMESRIIIIYCNNEINMKYVGKLLIKNLTARKSTNCGDKIKKIIIHINKILFENKTAETFEVIKYNIWKYSDTYHNNEIWTEHTTLKEFIDMIKKFYEKQDYGSEDSVWFSYYYNDENIIDVTNIHTNEVEFSIRLRQNNKALNLSDLRNLINDNCNYNVIKSFANFLQQSDTKNCPFQIN